MSLALSQNWWTLAVRGALAVAFGLCALFWTTANVAGVAVLFGLYAVVDGLFTFATGMLRPVAGERAWWSLLVEGLLGVGCGLAALVWPALTLAILLEIVAVWAIVTGIFSIVASERLRREMPGETLLGVAGVIAVVLGLALAMIPGIELLAMLFLAGLFGLAFGADMILLSLRFRRSGTPAAFFAEERLVSAASEKSELGGARRAPAWGAVLAGAVVAVAAFFVIDTLGAALGFSVSERITGENLATSSAVWMTLSVVTALFFGGWFMARQIGAETTPQACMHGTLLWGVVFVGLLYFATTGIVTGLSSVMGVPEPSIESYDPLDWDEDGLPLSLSMVLANPLTKTAAWWAFGGMVASLLATIGGSAAGRRAAVYRVVAHRTPRRETAGLFSNKPLSV